MSTALNKKRKKLLRGRIVKQYLETLAVSNTSGVLSWDVAVSNTSNDSEFKLDEEILDYNRREQTTFIWHVTVNSRKLSATVTTDIRLSPTSLVFDTAIFTPSNGHLYLIQWSPSVSTSRHRSYLLQRFLRRPTVTCIWYSDLPQSLPADIARIWYSDFYAVQPLQLEVDTVTRTSPAILIFACIVVNSSFHCPPPFFPGLEFFLKWVC